LTFGPNDPSIPIDDDLQRGVSSRLFDCLSTMSPLPAGPYFPVRVNLSLALVRWFHPDHYDRWLKLCADFRQRHVEPETIENLERWVMRWR